MNDLFTRTEPPVLPHEAAGDFLALVALLKEIEADETAELDFNTEH